MLGTFTATKIEAMARALCARRPACSTAPSSSRGAPVLEVGGVGVPGGSAIPSLGIDARHARFEDHVQCVLHKPLAGRSDYALRRRACTSSMVVVS